jgi:hypothetical protein
MGWRSLTTALMAAVLVGAEPAEAAPPTLVSVGHVRGHPSASWTLPPGVEPQTVEVATQSLVASDGSFFQEYVKIFDVVSDQPSRTTWLSAEKLNPGRYYVHVSGFDEACALAGQCPFREWSNILVLEIPRPAPKPRTPPKPGEAEVVRLGRGMGVWRLGMQYRSRPGLRRVIRRPRHFGTGCIAGAVLASRIDYYAGVRVSWNFWRDQRGRLRSILVEVASTRPGDRSDDGFVIGKSALASVRARHSKHFERHPPSTYRLGRTLVMRFRKTGYESGEYVDYWFNAGGRLVALASGISGC